MYGRIRSFLSAGSAALLAAVSLVALTPSPAAAAISCRGQYYPTGNVMQGSAWVATTATWTAVGGGWTTSYCQDIQVRRAAVSPDYDYFCVVFVDVTNNCNYTTAVYRNGTWYNIATNVRDDVRYEIRAFVRNGRSGVFTFDYAG
ncbi:hypothetical protein [Catellatospora citrea]|nr:hypothetical protein [Catellatospora citrea]RKE11252.1 hypothetical protein C8E86_6176 [Catellatospora citrea]